MADFNKYAPILKKVEGYGIFTNVSGDRGGATMSGVTLSTFRKYYGMGKTAEDLKKMTEAQWKYIMKSGYWDKCKADRIKNQSVANIIADWVVNSGPVVLKKVQSIVHAEVDGIVGPKTITAINGAYQPSVFRAVKNARETWYRRTVQTTPSQAKFLKGWLNRLDYFKYEP